MRVQAAVPTAFARVFSWTGALLFFISLAYFLLTYLTRFGDVAAGEDTISAVTWNVMLFTSFALHHSVFARERVRRWVTHTIPAELERSFYIWIASLLFILVCAWWRPVAGMAWQADGIALWVLRTLQAVGLWLTLKSATVLDIQELAGLQVMARNLPGSRGEPNGGVPTAPARRGAVARPTAETEFKTTGPYGWIRHPIYSGWFLFVFAASPMTMTRLVFAIVSCVYLLIAIPFEERSMRAAAPGAYQRYVARVPWRLLPGVY